MKTDNTRGPETYLNEGVEWSELLAHETHNVNARKNKSSGSVCLWRAHLARDPRARRPCHSFKLTHYKTKQVTAKGGLGLSPASEGHLEVAVWFS
jgi:hypothetical protein